MSSCSKQFELTTEDEKVIFTIKDIKDFDSSSYNIKKLKNGKDYFYSKTENILHGFYSLYAITYYNENGKEIELKTNLSIQKSKDGAIELLNGHIKTLIMMDKENLYELKGQDYNVDQIYIYSTEDQTLVTLQKGNLFYQIDVQGLQLNEEQIKLNIIKKIDYLIRSGLGKYKVK